MVLLIMNSQESFGRFWKVERKREDLEMIIFQ